MAVERQPHGDLLPAGELRALQITYRAPAPPGSSLNVELEPFDSTPELQRVRYRITLRDIAVADAEATWQLSGPRRMVPIPEIAELDGRPFSFDQAVRTYEVGPSGTVRPQAVVQ